MAELLADIPVPDAATALNARGALGIDELGSLMDAVRAATEGLHQTHEALRGEVARLQGELAEANARLRRTQALAALGEMAAGIAHEIRNPLGSIQLYAQALAEDVADQPESATLCTKISRSVQTLDAIVRDVLLFARDLRIRPAMTCPLELLDAALAQCDGLLTARSVAVEITGRSRPVPADQTLVVQAIANVVRNAAEAMGEAGTEAPMLRITCSDRLRRGPDGARRQYAGLAIADNGPGIAPEVVERIFNPFFTTRATGTGLGLAIVHRIVDAHGGHLDVRAAECGGACLELCLPLAPVSDQVPPASATDALDPEPALAAPLIEIHAPRTRHHHHHHQKQDAP